MEAKKRKTEEDYTLPATFMQQMSIVTVDNLKTQDNTIFVCKRDDKMIEVWKGLVKHQFHSCPVVLKTDDTKFWGVIDLHDICKYVMNIFGKEELSKLADFWKDVKKVEKLKNVTVNDIMRYPNTRENPFKPVTKGYSLHFALELMARETNLQRIPVISKERKLANMLTQSRLVQFFHENKALLGNRLNKPIGLLDCSSSGVISIHETQLAVDGFNLMQKHNITAIAVVDKDEKLKGVISETDLKVISEDGGLFYKLYQDAKGFLKSIESKKGGVVTVKKENTFGEVIDLLCDKKVHRVFVVNGDHKPTGVVAFKDIIADIMLK